MAIDRSEIRVSITKLFLGLLIIIVPLSIVGLILTTRSDTALDNNIGNEFRTIADIYSNEAAQFVRDRVGDVNMMTGEPAIIEAVSGGGRRGGAPARAEGAAGANQAATGGGGAAAKGILATNSSELLRRRRDLDPRFLNIVATDQSGTIVAASQKQTKSSFAGEADWQAAYNDGKGAVRVSNILFDEFSKSYYLNVNAPVFDTNSSRCIGVLVAAVSVSSLLSRFQQGQIANGARAELVSDDGTIISAPNADVFARLKSQVFDAARESLGSLQGHQSGSVTTRLQNRNYIVGFADTGLKQNYNNLGWIVLVSQDEHDAAAPMRAIHDFALAMVVLGLLMVTLLGVYYYLHRAQRFSDIEGVVPAEERRARATSG